MKLRITVWNAEGKVVTDQITEADTASEAEVEKMVALIEAGVPASLAARIVKQEADPA